MKWLRQALVFLCFLSTFSAFSFAMEFPKSPWTEEPAYLDKLTHKLGFGAVNVLTGWTALFYELHYQPNKLVGLGKGLGYTVTNTIGGALHAFTFPIPVDIPLPNGGIAYEYKR